LCVSNYKIVQILLLGNSAKLTIKLTVANMRCPSHLSGFSFLIDEWSPLPDIARTREEHSFGCCFFTQDNEEVDKKLVGKCDNCNVMEKQIRLGNSILTISISRIQLLEIAKLSLLFCMLFIATFPIRKFLLLKLQFRVKVNQRINFRIVVIITQEGQFSRTSDVLVNWNVIP